MSPQETIAHYRITAKIGEGGMGEVWRATDTKLGREVAIKILPESFSQYPDRLARFEREAQVLAALNHPNIASIYGVEERAIVMELVEGETLTGPLPVEIALDYARQIAEALEYAHERGIVHRDLKPANIRITPEGRVKVLDFGLAKAMTEETSAGEPSISPTLTMGSTRAGVLLGTAAYMSPEQARGKTADKRADIWAFGVVLYEMLTGKRLFEGETISDTLAAVLTREPDWRRAPAKFQRLLRKCLEKDPKRRLRDMGDAWDLLEEAPSPARPRGLSRWWAPAAVILGLAALAVSALHFREIPLEPAPIRFQILPPEKTRFTATPFAVSPDGRQLAFSAERAGGQRTLWVRPFTALAAYELPGTDGAVHPFWSPDSRFIGFFTANKLKKSEVAGRGPAPPQAICDLPGLALGGTWSRTGVILFGIASGGLFRVAESGGAAIEVRTPGWAPAMRIPWFMPDGRHYLDLDLKENAGIYVAMLDSTERRRIAGSTYAGAYAPPSPAAGKGHLLFIREGTLMALPLDRGSFEPAGEAYPVAEQLGFLQARSLFSVSANGVLAYRSVVRRETPLLWFDRQGNPQGTAAPPGYYLNLALSRDGRRAALVKLDPEAANNDIWILDLERGGFTRFTDDPTHEDVPVWSPDGSRIVFGSLRRGAGDLYQKDSGGAGRDELLLESSFQKAAFDWSDDGRFLIYSVRDPKTQLDLWVLPLEGDRKPVPFIAPRPYNETQAQFSPGAASANRWVAYCSDESGRQEIYVQRFPADTERILISNGGGSLPRWRRDGKELYYIAPDGKLMAVEVKAGTRFERGVPEPLFDARIRSSTTPLSIPWAPAPDGKRFLVITRGDESASPPITVVVNWQAAVKP